MLTILPNQPRPPLLTVCDGQMQLDVNFEPPDEDFDDNVHLSLSENGPKELRLFVADEIGFTLTSAEARILATNRACPEIKSAWQAVGEKTFSPFLLYICVLIEALRADSAQLLSQNGAILQRKALPYCLGGRIFIR